MAKRELRWHEAIFGLGLVLAELTLRGPRAALRRVRRRLSTWPVTEPIGCLTNEQIDQEVARDGTRRNR
jgi:hypothetical protein